MTTPAAPPAPGAPRLWILSPVYFDVESYRILRRNLEDELRATPFAGATTFVVVDDSGDADPEIAALESDTGTRVLRAPFSLGHQRAIVFGLRTLAGEIDETDVVVTLDADGEDQPSDLRRLLAPLLDQPENVRTIALAMRTRRRESAAFKVLYFFYKIFFRALTGTLIRSGNYVAFRGWFARNLLFHPHFDLCYSSSVVSFSVPVTRVPCARGVRYAGRSRMTYLKLVMHGIRMLMPFADRIAIRGVVAFSMVIALSFAFGAWVVAVRLFTDAAIPGWATSTLLLSFVLGGVALACVILLFTLYVQMTSLSMSRLDVHLRDHDGVRARRTPAGPG